jgi:succinyl-diaminopimelate desuccinylase
MDKAGLLARIEADRDAIITFLASFVRAPSPNPPGDTREATEIVTRFLAERGLPHRVLAAQDHLPNILGSFEGGAPGQHLVLNGHIDVFPAGDGWTRNPWSGEIEGRRLWGRGTADMKAGTVASIMAYAYLFPHREQLRGRLTLTAVSDEETGGKYGARFLLENHAEECLGDAVLNGEPGGLQTVRFGEKGTLRLTFTTRTPGGFGAATHRSANAVKLAARLIGDLEALTTFPVTLPAPLEAILNEPGTMAALDSVMGPGTMAMIGQVSVNVGVIRGGAKVNMIPGLCETQVDIRLPPGLDKAPVMARIHEILQLHPETSVEEQAAASNPASWSDPAHPLVGLVQANVRALGHETPLPACSLGGSDCKFWRYRGVPAFYYGVSPDRLAGPDEGVDLDEFLHVVKVHAATAWDYLGGP